MITVSHDEFVAVQRAAKVFEGIYMDDLIAPQFRNAAYSLRVAMDKFLQFFQEEVSQDEDDV